jgi:hypothetical protein
MNQGYYNHVFSNSSQWEFLPHIYAVAAVNLSTRKHTDEGMKDPEQGYRLGCSIKADPAIMMRHWAITACPKIWLMMRDIYTRRISTAWGEL